MAPIKSSLARSAKQLLGFFNTADLGLRGAIKIRKLNASVMFSGGTEITSGETKFHVFWIFIRARFLCY